MAKARKPTLFLLLAAVIYGGLMVGFSSPKLIQTPEARELGLRQDISMSLGSAFRKNQLPEKAQIEWQGSNENVKVIYTLNPRLQELSHWLLTNYKPDYSTIVALDATTGKILAMASYEGSNPSSENWALKATFPAASIFKMVTAAVALEKYSISPEKEIAYVGPNYKLYKRNLLTNAENQRWAKSISLKEAFAKSINIFFGKLTLQFMQPHDLIEYADRFKFNQRLPSDLPVDSSFATIQNEEPFHVAEVASGFNDVNTLSPLHGAALAAAVAYDGVMKAPFVVDRVVTEDGNLIYNSAPLIAAQPVSSHTALNLRILMQETIDSGTSRKSFKELKKSRRFSEVEVGGKTGSLTGDNPKGKTDWFVGYGRSGDKVIAVAAVTVNRKYWRVKSAYLGQRIIRDYFDQKMSEEKSQSRSLTSEHQ